MILVNGQPRSTIETSDRGLLYGDGLFETMAALGGAVPLWDRHMQRLCADSERLGITPPDTHLLRNEAATVLQNAAEKCVLKILVSRGSGGNGYQPADQISPTRIIECRDWPASVARYQQEGVRVRFCATRLAVGSPVAGIKHLNRLEQVLARAEWSDDEFAEGLMLDQDGFVVEGTKTNLFIQEGDRLMTPPVNHCGVAGVMRGLVMDLARKSAIDMDECRLTPDRVLGATAAFLTNAIIGLWPIRELQTTRFTSTSLVDEIQSQLQVLPPGSLK